MLNLAGLVITHSEMTSACNFIQLMQIVGQYACAKELFT